MKDYKILEGEIGWDITLNEVSQTNKFIINSYGGDLDAGFAIHDYFKSNDIEMGVMGVCASSATIALLGAKNRWGSKNSQFLIHNPWTVAMGESKDLQKTADELKNAQEKLIALYVGALNKDEAYIRELMLADSFINAEQALELGLINEIREDELKPLEGKSAKAMFYNLKKGKMSKEQITKNDLANFEDSLVDKIKNFFSKPKIQDIVLKDVNGVELDFSVETVEEITEGVTATVDGVPADGDYVMPEGQTYTFEKGALTGMTEASNEPDEMAALKAENEELKTKLAELDGVKAETEETIQNLKSDYESKLKDIQDGFEAFKNKFSNKVNDVNTPEHKEKEEKTTKAFKTKQTLKI